MHAWTVTWTRRRHDGPEIYPYNRAVGVREDDLRSPGYEEGRTRRAATILPLPSVLVELLSGLRALKEIASCHSRTANSTAPLAC